MNQFVPTALFLAIPALTACGGDAHDHGGHSHSHGDDGYSHGEDEADHDDLDHDDHDHEEAELDLSEEARRNLGVEFAPIERRVVADTLRVPGEFELLPEATREHRVVLGGRVRLFVKQYQRVDRGDVLLELVSPAWRTAQHEIVEAEGEIQLAEAEQRVTEARLEEGRELLALLDERLGALSDADVRNAELESRRATSAATLPRLEAERRATEVRLAEAHEHLHSLTRTLAALSGLSVDRLLANVPGPDGESTARFRTIDALPLVAELSGVVDQLAVGEGSWVAAGDLAVVVIDPDQLRFRGRAPIVEASGLTDGARVSVVAPRSSETLEPASGILGLGPVADSRTRTLPILVRVEARPAWVRAGVAAYAEIIRAGAAESVLAVPVNALVREDLETFLYVRSPTGVERVEPTLGTSDGWWVEVSGVEADAEVVVRGAYALKLAQGGGDAAPDGFHFHADGSMHADDEDE